VLLVDRMGWVFFSAGVLLHRLGVGVTLMTGRGRVGRDPPLDRARPCGRRR
jgi:hypothetical protein